MTLTLDARDSLGILLLIVQAALAVPLIWRLARATTRRGISLTGEMIWIAGGLGWAVYALLAHSPTVFVSSIIAIATSGILSGLLWRDAGDRRGALLLTLATVVFLAGALTVAGLPGISFALSVFGALQFLPQLVVSVRQIVRNERTSGVSIVGVGIRAVYTLGWAVWAGAFALAGATTAGIDWPILTWGLAGTLAFGVQLAVTLRSTRASGSHRLIG